jgi:High-affinity nickel-transport protein
MFGLDAKIASCSDGTTLLIVIGVAVLLGLRHASDPDHVAAVTTLVASERERASRNAARLGLAWGLGHATTLFLFGLPVVLYSAYLPTRLQQAAEMSVGIVIVALALVLLARWRRGAYSEGARHSHARRTGVRAFGVGLVHGMGGTAGVGLLLLATISSQMVAVIALALFAFFTAVSMTVLSTGWSLALGSAPVRRSFHRVAPALGFVSLAFGVWYALGAQGVVPYVL